MKNRLRQRRQTLTSRSYLMPFTGELAGIAAAIAELNGRVPRLKPATQKLISNQTVSQEPSIIDTWTGSRQPQ